MEVFPRTSPRRFGEHNEGNPYEEQVKPFGFLLACQTGALPFSGENLLRPVSAYDGDLAKAAEGCFDRETGEPVPSEQLKCYHAALAQFHLKPESKFHNGDYADQGLTRRRHVRAMVMEYIGKEANRWEEQLHLGLDLGAQTEYGIEPNDYERVLMFARRASKQFGQRRLAATADVSLSELSAILCNRRTPTPATLAKLYRAIPRLETDAPAEAEHVREMLDAVRRRSQLVGVREFARRAGMDNANLAKVLSGQRKSSRLMLAKLETALISVLESSCPVP